ncbi:MAG: TonB-dependent receptor [Kofleriaceae bacterium]|nr:TonB-dependent receptor [Kofleriaceae bacterium]
MSRTLVVGGAALTLALAAPPAAADDALGQRRELFGLDPPAPPAVVVDCADGEAAPCVRATDPIDDDAAPALRTRLRPDERWALPGVDASIDGLAGLALGLGRDDAGVTAGGATGLDNRWTIGGAPIEHVRTGGLELRVPLLFVRQLDVRAGGATAADRIGFGAAVDVGLLDGADARTDQVRAVGWIGLGAARPRPAPLPGTYQVATGTFDPARASQVAISARGPLSRLGAALGGRAWYAAGLGATLLDLGYTRRATRLVDADADGQPDRDGAALVTEPVATTGLPELGATVPVMVRLGAARGPHHLELDLVGALAEDVRMNPMATPGAAGVDRRSGALAATLRWRGRWGRTRARVLAGWYTSRLAESPRVGSATTPQVQTAFIPGPVTLPNDPALAAGCSDGDGDPYPGVPNCPVPIGWFARGGAGLLVDQASDRPVVRLDLDRRLGDHVVRTGALAEDARTVHTLRYSGDVLTRSLFEGHRDEVRFAELGSGDGFEVCDSETGATCRAVASARLTYRTRQLAAYLQDDWRPLPGLVVTAGARWEQTQLGGAVRLRDQVAPRLGMAWDPADRGRVRVFASLGRSFLAVPTGLGEAVVARAITTRVSDSPFGTSRVLDDGAVTRVASTLEAPFADQVALGASASVVDRLWLTAWADRRWVRRGLEDVAGIGLTNPASAGTSARRQATTLAAELRTGGEPLWLRLAYAHTRARGSWLGPYDPRQGVTLYTGDDFDDGAANLDGLLPGDSRHRVLAEVVVRGALGRHRWSIGSRGLVASGRPLSVLAPSDAGTVYLLPRGLAGRLGHTSTLSAMATLGLAGRLRGIELFVDASNLMRRADATAVSEVYTPGGVRPIDGGDRADLVFLKREDADAGASPAPRSAGYGQPTGYQAPLVVVVGARAGF